MTLQQIDDGIKKAHEEAMEQFRQFPELTHMWFHVVEMRVKENVPGAFVTEEIINAGGINWHGPKYRLYNPRSKHCQEFQALWKRAQERWEYNNS